jgi:hypothetical protein
MKMKPEKKKERKNERNEKGGGLFFCALLFSS